MATGIESAALLAARLLFGGVVAFMGLNHFLQTAQMTGYAQHKGLPVPKLAVVGSGALLVVSGAGLVVGAFPLVSGLAAAGFLVVSALLMHDFWAVGDEQTQDELTHFLKNLVMAGGALALVALSGQEWAYSIGLGL